MSLVSQKLDGNFRSNFRMKQTGTGPSRRHIKGLKIAKGLQSANVLTNWGPFDDFFLKKVSMPNETEKGDPLGFINIHSVAKLFGDKFVFQTKCPTMPKKGPFSLSRYGMLRGKTGKSITMLKKIERGTKSLEKRRLKNDIGNW